MKLIVEGPKGRVEKIATLLRGFKVSVTKEYAETSNEVEEVKPLKKKSKS